MARNPIVITITSNYAQFSVIFLPNRFHQFTNHPMSFASKVKNGGWGALFLWVYVLAILLWFDIKFGYQRLIVLSIAAVPSLIVMFVAEQFINFLNDWWAGGHLKQSTEIAYQLTGEKHPYEALDADAQSRVSEFDNKSYGKQVTILAGLLIAVSAPFTGFFGYGLLGIIGGLFLTGVSLWAFVYQPVEELKDLASGIADVYQQKYENQ